MPPRAFKRMLIWLSESCHPRRQPERGPGPRAEPRGGHGAATNNAHGGRGQANRQMGAHLWCAIWPPSTAPSFSPAPFTAPSCSPAPFTTPSFSPAPRHSGSQPEHPNAEDQGWAESRQERPGNDAYEMPALNAAIWTSCIKSCPCPVLNKLQHPSFFHHMNHEVLFLAPDAFDFEALQVSRPSPHTFWRAQHFCISAQRISPSRNASSTWVGREFPLRSSHSRAAGVRRCYVPGVQAPPQLARVCPVRSHQLMPPHLNGISEINEISLIS